MTSPANCTICGQQANPDGQLQCECHSTNRIIEYRSSEEMEIERLQSENSSLRAKLETEREQRIAAELRCDGARRDAVMLARLVEELRRKMKDNHDQASLKNVCRLLNAGEFSEALKELRIMHGLVNRFVCESCGYMSNKTGTFGCPKCDGSFPIKVVIEKKTAPADGAGKGEG